MGKVYVLSVGINDYSQSVGKLQGCVNDVDALKSYLSDVVDKDKLCLETLTDSDATRANIIKLFRSHLGQASADDVVLFHYSGHGARCRAAKEFKRFYPDGWDEGLVCVDSREPGGFDLADKELAVLLAEIAANNPHIAVLLDSCHSGNATRKADDFLQARPRVTHQIFDERPLESYLDGYYSNKRLEQGGSLEIPASRHILLSACERVQKAWEGRDHRGVFSSSLLDALSEFGPDISYADLFMRVRTVVRRSAENQTPQFETYQQFNAYNGFLGSAVSGTSRSYNVYFDNNTWKAECGALHGLPNDPSKTVELALYRGEELAGRAEAVQVGAQTSEIQLLDAEVNHQEQLQGRVTSLPVPPLEVSLTGDAQGVKVVLDSFSSEENQASGFIFDTDTNTDRAYTLTAENGQLLLREGKDGRLLQGAEGYTLTAALYLFSILERIVFWERAAVLQNHSTRMDQGAVTFQLAEYENNEPYPFSGDEVTLDFTDERKEIIIKFSADNRSDQPLHFAIAWFSDDFRIQAPYNEPVIPTNEFVDLILGGDSPEISLLSKQVPGEQTTIIAKLIVSTEKIDGFLLEQDGMKIGRIQPAFKNIKEARESVEVNFGRKKIYENEWFTKTIRITLVQRLDKISTNDLAVVDQKITIKGHSSLTADVSLGGVRPGSRSAGGDSDFYRALERQGLELLNFSREAKTRGGAESILELSDIKRDDALENDPLEIELDFGLTEEEYILPLTFDGEHILLAGEPEKDAEGRTLIHIDHIPDGIPDHRRSLGKALKLYFFKTYLKKDNVNLLRWVEFRKDGSVKRHKGGVADKVAAANNILLLIHGIIGDTENIAQGLMQAKDMDGTSLDKKFDVVLTYDYENLSTKIEQTALKLKMQLHDVGLHEQDDKRLTLLAHSMGGLVSRCFIEKEAGNKMVDHLVMCGTPHVGSPFGKIGSARSLTGVLTTWAMNFFVPFAPFGAGLLTVLGRSKKVTPTLEQMHPGSEFILRLNNGDDPGVPYTVLAGDVRRYDTQNDGLMAKLIAKVGKGRLFEAMYDNAGHDIAVALDSIQGVPDARQPVPVKDVVDCHHLNYFVSEAGLRALGEVEW